MADERKVSEMYACIRALNPSTRVVRTVFRPKPLEDIRGQRVLFTTTATPAAGETIRGSLEREYGCEVVAVSHHLSNRPKLRADVAEAIRGSRPSVLVTELKAAAVDVATMLALEAGLRVVYADNIPIEIEGEPGLAQEVLQLAEAAVERFEKRAAL